MKKLLLILLSLTFSTLIFAQKGFILGDGIGMMRARVGKQADLSSKFKALVNQATAQADEDCTPPPCTGIIDPWTCECHPDIKDPWEDDKIASRLKAVQSMEAAIKRGEGKSLLTSAHYSQANKRYPGKSLKAIVGRLNYYASVVK